MIEDLIKLAWLWGAGWVLVQLINASQYAAVYDHTVRGLL